MDRTMLIGGEWVAASREETMAVTNPYDASSLGTVPKGSR